MRTFSTGTQGFKNLLVFASSAIILTVCLLLSSSSLSAQGRGTNSSSSHESERAAQVRALNNSVLQLHGQMQENASGAVGIRGLAAMVLAQRAAALQTLIQEDPHTALTFAFAPELLADLATKFPDSAAQLESHATLSGTAERWIADDLKNPSASTEAWFLKVNETTLALHFATPQRPTATNITITGVRVGSSVAVSKISSDSQAALVPTMPGSVAAGGRVLVLAAILLVLARFYIRFRSLFRRLVVCCACLAVLLASPLAALAQTCSTTGPQKTAVLLISFQDLAVAMTPSDANDVIFDTSTGHSVNGFWQDASHGQTSASGSVFGPITVGASASYSCSNIAQVFFDAVSASGLDLTSYNRIFIFMPGINCAWGGFTINGAGNAGCTQWSTTSGTVTASLSFVIDSLLSSGGRDSAVQTSSHEGGHQLTLGHSGTITDEPTAVLGSTSSPGGRTEFNDFFSVMGEGIGYTVLSGYGAQHQAEELGWLTPNTSWQTVTSGGSFTLNPLEVNTGGLQALKVARGSGNTAEYLWVEYRQPIGYDSTNFFMNFNGALIHYAPTLANYASKYTSVMDFTASDVGRWFNTVLAPGQTWTDSYSNVSITVLSATPSGLTVSVSYGASACTPSSPSVLVSPLNPSIYPGQTASYSVSVTNNDSPGCSANTINLGSSEPSGWSTAFSSPSVTLNSGQSTSITLGKGAPSGTMAGMYAVNMTASTTTSTTTDTANATVMTPPTLAANLSIAAASYTRPGSASITATVINGGTAVSGASVTFTLRTPNGGTTTQTATTGTNGTATWNYKLNNRSQTGTYSAVALATLSSGSRKSASTQSTTSNTISFAVQ